jgi:hypothetical protein
MRIVLTKHSMDRLKQRNGLRKKSMQRITEKAWYEGIDRLETNGKFRKFLEQFYYYDTDFLPAIKIYGDKVFIFKMEKDYIIKDDLKKQEDIAKLITVLQIPSRLMKLKPIK